MDRSAIVITVNTLFGSASCSPVLSTSFRTASFNLKTSQERYKVTKSITGLTHHQPYGLVVLSANGRPVAIDAIGY